MQIGAILLGPLNFERDTTKSQITPQTSPPIPNQIHQIMTFDGPQESDISQYWTPGDVQYTLKLRSSSLTSLIA